MPHKARSQLHVRIGGRVRKLRLGRGLTQAMLAERIGRSNHFISGIERGVDSPSLSTLEALAAALGTRIAALVEEEEHVSPVVGDAAAELVEMLRDKDDPRLVSVLREIVALYDANRRR